MTKSSKVISLCFIAFLYACSSKQELHPDAYVRYLNSNSCGLSTSKTLNKITYRCRLQTPELITLTTSEKGLKNRKDFESERLKHKKQLNAIFVIGDESKSHRVKETIFRDEDYNRLLSYSWSGLQNDFNLQLPNGDLIPCSFVHVEPRNSIQPVIRITVAFDNVDTIVQDYRLVFDDNLFHTGRLKFHYDKEVFAALPTLKFES